MWYFYANPFCLSIFCRVRYCVTCIVAVATFLFIKLIIGITFLVSRF